MLYFWNEWNENNNLYLCRISENITFRKDLSISFYCTGKTASKYLRIFYIASTVTEIPASIKFF